MIPIINGHIIAPHDFGSIDSVVTAQIRIKKGEARAILPGELETYPFYESVKSRSRSFDLARRERVDSILEKHINRDTRFDDRKLRFSGCSFLPSPEPAGENVLEIAFGPSHFEEHLATNNRCLQDANFYARLAAVGQRDFNDPFAYLANNLAMNAVLRTSDDRYMLGLRSKSQRFYPGYWHNIGGFYEASQLDLFDLEDNGQAIVRTFKERMLKELMQEAKVQPESVSSLRMIAITYGLSSVDINYDARTDADSEYIIRTGHFKAKDQDEHTGFRGVTFGELVDVLEGKKILDLQEGVVEKPSSQNREFTKVVPLGLGGLLVHIGLQDPEALDRIIRAPQHQYPL